MTSIILDNFDDKIKLYKIDFKYFNDNYYTNLYFNRKINEEKVNELYEILWMNNYQLPWTCHSIYDIKNDKKQLIDGQHRHEAVCKYIDKYLLHNENKYLYMWEYIIEDINEAKCNKYSLDLFKKLNNNSPLLEEDIPKNKIVELLLKLKTNKNLKNGIGTDNKHKTCNSPKIHEKELFELLNKHEYLFSSKSIEEIIENILEINIILSKLNIINLYKNKSVITIKEKKILEKANNYNFYLGIKDSAYQPAYWIKYISNPNNII